MQYIFCRPKILQSFLQNVKVSTFTSKSRGKFLLCNLWESKFKNTKSSGKRTLEMLGCLYQTLTPLMDWEVIRETAPSLSQLPGELQSPAGKSKVISNSTPSCPRPSWDRKRPHNWHWVHQSPIGPPHHLKIAQGQGLASQFRAVWVPCSPDSLSQVN